MTTTAFAPTTTRQLVLDRDEHRCVVCGRSLTSRPYAVIRRTRHQPRTVANLISVCGTGRTACRNWIRRHRGEGFAAGLLIGAADDPASSPMIVYWAGWVQPTGDGSYRPLYDGGVDRP